MTNEEKADMRLTKWLGIINTALIIMLWIFTITVNDIKGKALDRATKAEEKVQLLEQRLDAYESLPRMDTIVINMNLNEYIKTTNKNKK